MNHPIENIMHSSMEHIKALADVNTVVGDPFMTDDDTMIVPVSKVSLGMLVGGGEYTAMQSAKKNSSESNAEKGYPFVGASTVGMCLSPLAFLAVQNGTVRVLPAKQDHPCDRLIDLVPQMIDTVQKLIGEMCGKGCENSEDSSGRKHEKSAGKAAREAEKAAEKAAGAAGKAFEAFEKAEDAAADAAEAAARAQIEAEFAEAGEQTGVLEHGRSEGEGED